MKEQKVEKPPVRWLRDKALAKMYYRNAFWTSLMPAYTLFMLLCGIFSRSGSRPYEWFTRHWIINTCLSVCIIGLLCYAVAEVVKGIRLASRYAEPGYDTKVFDGPDANGKWIAELRMGGVPYQKIDVGSISDLLKNK